MLLGRQTFPLLAENPAGHGGDQSGYPDSTKAAFKSRVSTLVKSCLAACLLANAAGSCYVLRNHRRKVTRTPRGHSTDGKAQRPSTPDSVQFNSTSGSLHRLDGESNSTKLMRLSVPRRGGRDSVHTKTCPPHPPCGKTAGPLLAGPPTHRTPSEGLQGLEGTEA